jgi:AbiTii
MSDTLLNQIRTEAVDSEHDLGSLLRKCRVLAQRLNNADLKTWVMSELDGYQDESNLPDYRVLRHALLLGHYIGAFGSQLKNIQIPLSAVMEEFRQDIVETKVVQGVRGIRELIANSEGGSLRIALPSEAHAAIRDPNVREDMVLASAVKIINTSPLEGILDTVRNRILNFTLELDSEAPKTGDPIDRLRVEKSEKVQQIFNTQIMGNVANLAQASSQFSQVVDVPKGDASALRAALKSIGLDRESIEELTAAATEEKPSNQGAFGHRVSTAIGKAVTKASQGLLKVSTSVAANILTEVLKSYYGI